MLGFLEEASGPTMYFIGVTTAKSSIMKVFPEWAKALGIEGAVLKGIDLEIGADPSEYGRVVEFIKRDPCSLGALITTHKIDVYRSAHQLFEYLDPYAQMFEELSCISKKEGRLEGYAKDPISSGLAMEAFIPKNFWATNEGEALIMGAGGSAIAICSDLAHPSKGENIPSRILVTDIHGQRLQELERVMSRLNPSAPLVVQKVTTMAEHDQMLTELKPYSLVVNATGLGKDRPGSPVTNCCSFPKKSLVWELNYRGDLKFLHQAKEQEKAQSLTVEDGWIYFIHGWTQVISEVFHVPITHGVLPQLAEIAAAYR